MRCTSNFTLWVVFTISNNVLVFSITVCKSKHTYLINKGNWDVDYFLLCVMVSLLASSVIVGPISGRIKPITMKRVLGASPLIMLYYGVMSGWHGVGIPVTYATICLSGRVRNCVNVGILQNRYQYSFVKSSFFSP